MRKYFLISSFILLFFLTPGLAQARTRSIDATVRFSTTCGRDNQQLSSAVVGIFKKNPYKGDVAVAENIADLGGNGTLKYTGLYDAEGGDSFYVAAEPLFNKYSAEDNSNIPLDINEISRPEPMAALYQIDKDVAFHYPECPNIDSYCHQFDGNIENSCIDNTSCGIGCNGDCVSALSEKSDCGDNSSLKLGDNCDPQNDTCDKSNNLSCQANPITGASLAYYCQAAVAADTNQPQPNDNNTPLPPNNSNANQIDYPQASDNNQGNVNVLTAEYISNYPDCRDTNDPGDLGSVTQTVPQIPEWIRIDWTPSNLSPNTIYFCYDFTDHREVDSIDVEQGNHYQPQDYLDVNVGYIPQPKTPQ